MVRTPAAATRSAYLRTGVKAVMAIFVQEELRITGG
jgi:hypothetical protein